MSQIRLSKREYQDAFDKRETAALKSALEARKFEIELYWKRATYFWTFIGATFAAYALIYAEKGHPENSFLLTLFACLGFVFSIAWHYVNKGSKFWQENWENHVELLEDEHHGPLYKTITERPDPKNCCEKLERFFVAPKPFSVSKINQLVSTFVVWIWVLLLVKGFFVGNVFFVNVWNAFPLILALLSWLSFLTLCKSHSGKHRPKAYLRKTRIKNRG